MLTGSAKVELRPPLKPLRSVVGNGVYMILLEKRSRDHDLFVVFRDSAGEIVPWPNPAVLRTERAQDIDEPCPACQHNQWDMVEIRTEPDFECYRQRGLVCATCGLQYGGWEDVGRKRPGYAAGQA